MLDRYENTLHAIRVELDGRKHTFGIIPVIGDVTDAARVNAVLAEYQPEIIFHAAAHKHVPLMEENPCEAVKNNVRGTRVLAQSADAFGVEQFIMISTDKAVNPTSVMGATKRVAELVIQAQSVGSGTTFAVVRFGNVLGSNGSVVPHFMEQIRKGGPVTITHPDIRRFFMLIPEAVQLCACRGAGGERRDLRAGNGRAGEAARHGA
jgi:FlaA1/EpsC-like NDP-sugar epimerase